MVIRVGSFATLRRKPRQARKGAAVADAAGVEGVLARIASLPDPGKTLTESGVRVGGVWGVRLG
jgi:hypothetical protein